MINFVYNENSLIDCMDYVEKFEVNIHGKSKEIEKENKEFNAIFLRLKDLFANSRLMPAFGVSIHSQTLNELKNHKWIKICFSQEMSKNGLKFSSLLFKLEEVEGFNLIREFNNSYDGRCLYLDLNEKTNLLDLINFQ